MKSESPRRGPAARADAVIKLGKGNLLLSPSFFKQVTKSDRREWLPERALLGQRRCGHA
jgi:hypothetical protein